MDIKILGSGCAKCQTLERITHEAVDELGLSADFEKVTDRDAAIFTRKIVRDEGIFVGNSAGSAMAGLLQLKDLADASRRSLHRSPQSPRQPRQNGLVLVPFSVAEVMSDVGVWWGMGGGWAIDLWLGEQTREHHDVEVVVRRCDQAAVHAVLAANWELRCLDPPGSGWREWNGAPIEHPAFQLQARSSTIEFDIFTETVDDATWRFRRSHQPACLGGDHLQRIGRSDRSPRDSAALHGQVDGGEEPA